jgi:hypothetical protein
MTIETFERAKIILERLESYKDIKIQLERILSLEENGHNHPNSLKEQIKAAEEMIEFFTEQFTNL